MKTIKAISFITVFSLVFSTLFCITAYANYRGADENGWYSFSDFLIVLQPQYSSDTEEILADINSLDAVKSAEITSEPTGEADYCAMIFVKLYEADEAAFNDAVTNISGKHYVKQIIKSYYLGVNCYYGDIDANGKVTVEDARAILAFAAGTEKPKTNTQFCVADIDRDGAVTIDDARSVLQIAIGIKEAVYFTA